MYLGIFYSRICDEEKVVHNLVSKLRSNVKYVIEQTQNQVIYSYIKIHDPPKFVVSMSKIDQNMGVSKHIILETRMVVTIHPIYIPFTNFHHGYEITNKHITQLGKFEQ
jgi:hypothetical protein